MFDMSILPPRTTAVAAPEPDPALTELLDRFKPIDLARLNRAALLNRTDIKFIMHRTHLWQALDALSGHYWILEINGTRLNQYQTLYFDTADFDLYRRHHAGAIKRFKVRSRHYVDSNLAFFEVKRKLNDTRTVKYRLPIPALARCLTPETGAFLHSHSPLDAAGLEPTVESGFGRITLLHKQRRERLTVDLNLQFSAGQNSVALPGLVVAEVKQEGINRLSPFISQMRALGLRSIGLSKYCLGVSLLYPQVKHNNFNHKLRLVARFADDFTGGVYVN